MILADTGIWIDHIAAADRRLHALLESGRVVMHPMVIGELAMGSFRTRRETLADLEMLPHVQVGFHSDVLAFVDRHRLYGTGIGYIDAHLLVSARLTPHTKLWTRDRRLRLAAARFELADED